MAYYGTPEEIKEAKVWIEEQKKKQDEDYKKAKKKDPNAKKIILL